MIDIKFGGVTRFKIGDPHTITTKNGAKQVQRTIEITFGSGTVQRIYLRSSNTAGLLLTRDKDLANIED